MEVKLFVAAKYLDHKERREGLRPVLTKSAAECRVDWHFVVKIEREITGNKRILAPEVIYLAHANPIGPGSRSMSKEDFFLLYVLYCQDLTQSLSQETIPLTAYKRRGIFGLMRMRRDKRLHIR